MNRTMAPALGRYADIMEARGIVPFQRIPYVNPETGAPDPRVLGERLPMRWRVSRDEWDRLAAATNKAFGWTDIDSTRQELGGFLIEPDDSLPPATIIFEEAP